MNDDVAGILAMASQYPQLGIDALRAEQIALEAASLHAACAAAAARFPASDSAQFAILFNMPAAANHDPA